MRPHVSLVAQTCFYHLRRIRAVRRQFGRDVTARLVSTCPVSSGLLQLLQRRAGRSSRFHTGAVPASPARSGMHRYLKFAMKKLERVLYFTVQNLFRYLEPFRRG